jgi:hypothetical protein
MIIASIIIGFALLALGLLTLLDRYETAVDKSHADRRINKAPKQIYYDAFAERHQAQGLGDFPSNKATL